MAHFEHPLWGYAITYPDDWVHRSFPEAEGFAANPDALQPGYAGPNAGHLLVKAEGNWTQREVEPLWERHIGMVAGLLGARHVGAAAWDLGGMKGFEAEIALPKHEQKRLWTGVLAHGYVLLSLMVSHPLEERQQFEPAVTKVITSLKLLGQVQGGQLTPEGLPLPPGWSPVSPADVVDDIKEPDAWRAYAGPGSVAGLQAFYLREPLNHGWEITQFVPFPGPAENGFGRAVIRQEDRTLILAIVPGEPGEQVNQNSPARLVVKIL